VRLLHVTSPQKVPTNASYLQDDSLRDREDAKPKLDHTIKDGSQELQPTSKGKMLANPTLNSCFKLAEKRGKLANQETMRAQRHSQIFKGKGASTETSFQDDLLPHPLRDSTEENRRFGGVNLQTRNTPEDPQLLHETKDGGLVPPRQQKNIIRKSQMTDAQGLTLRMEPESRLLRSLG
jgi:hypothetical protein